MQVLIENTTTKFKRYYPEIEIKIDNPLFFSIEIDTRELEDGEYQITIYTDDNRVVGEEIIRIGEHNTATKTQYKVEKKFTQYVRQ